MTNDDELFQILIELGLDLPLSEMAMPRSKLIHRLINLQDHIIEHLIKLVISADNHPTKNHWKGELVGVLGDVMSFRAKGIGSKPLPFVDYYENLWEDVFEDPDTGLHVLATRVVRIAKQEKLKNTLEVVVIAQRLRNFYNAFCAMCAEGLQPERNRDRLIEMLGQV